MTIRNGKLQARICLLLFTSLMLASTNGFSPVSHNPAKPCGKFHVLPSPHPLYLAPTETATADVFLYMTGLKSLLPQNLPSLSSLRPDLSLVLTIIGALVIGIPVMSTAFVYGLSRTFEATCFREVAEFLKKEDNSAYTEYMSALADELGKDFSFETAYQFCRERPVAQVGDKSDTFRRLFVAGISRLEITLLEQLVQFDEGFDSDPLAEQIFRKGTLDMVQTTLWEVVASDYPQLDPSKGKNPSLFLLIAVLRSDKKEEILLRATGHATYEDYVVHEVLGPAATNTNNVAGNSHQEKQPSM